MFPSPSSCSCPAPYDLLQCSARVGPEVPIVVRTESCTARSNCKLHYTRQKNEERRVQSRVKSIDCTLLATDSSFGAVELQAAGALRCHRKGLGDAVVSSSSLKPPSRSSKPQVLTHP